LIKGFPLYSLTVYETFHKGIVFTGIGRESGGK
jgi:hypothetical protein